MPLDDAQELFYWVDEQDTILGSISRGEAHYLYRNIHRSVGIIIINTDQEILLQKRSLKKDKNPGVWSISVGGHVTFGSTYSETAPKELKEELGIQLSLVEKKRFLADVGDEVEMVTIFESLNAPTDLTFTLDADEVAEVRWIPLSQLATFIEREPFNTWSLRCLQVGGYL